MTQRLPSWRWKCPYPRLQFHAKDILIFHTYLCGFIMSLFTIVQCGYDGRENGGGTAILLILTMSLAPLITGLYLLLALWKNPHYSVGLKLKITTGLLCLPFGAQLLIQLSYQFSDTSPLRSLLQCVGVGFFSLLFQGSVQIGTWAPLCWFFLGIKIHSNEAPR